MREEDACIEPMQKEAEQFCRVHGYEPYYMYRQKNKAHTTRNTNQENVAYAKPGKECLYNIFIMEENEQFGVIDGLKDFYNTLDFEFWLVIADRPVDISVYIAELQMMYNSAQNPVIRKLINQDLSKAEDFNDNVSDVEFYFLFKDKNVDMIQKKIRLMINGLANAGLASSQANNDDLRSILDNFLNGGEKTEFGTVLA